MHEIATFEDLGEAERLAIAYATAAVKPRFTAFFMLDAQLCAIVAAAREPMLTQVRLAWWRDALASPAKPAPNAHPVLAAAGSAFGADRDRLVVLVDGWEALAVAEKGAAGSAALTEARAAMCCGIAPGAPPEAVQAHCATWSRSSTRLLAGDGAARDAVPPAPLPRLPRDLRPLAVIAGLARRSLARGDHRLLGDRLSPLAAIRLGILGR